MKIPCLSNTNLHKNLGFLCQSNKKQDHLPLFRLIRTLGTQFFVFKRLYYKHTKRIGEKKKEKNCPFSFFDVKGWIIMVFMITFGITMRSFHILPDAFISVFYTGLSLALIFTGVLFIRYWWINRKGNLFTPPPEE